MFFYLTYFNELHKIENFTRTLVLSSAFYLSFSCKNAADEKCFLFCCEKIFRREKFNFHA